MSPDIDSAQLARPHVRFSVGWLGFLFLVTATAIYFPALRGGILWDDPAHITSPALQSWSGLSQIWFKLGATQQYYPVLETAFWVEHRLWGDHVLGYHLVNIVFHATSALLFACVLRRIRDEEAEFSVGEFLAGGLFLVHPICVETVAWISEQKNTLSTVFYLLSALAYLRFDRARALRKDDSGQAGGRLSVWPWYGVALGFFVLALMSKSVTATLPAALLVVQWYRYGRIRWRRDVAPLSLWVAIGAAAGLFTAWVEKHYIGAQGSAYELTMLARTFLAGRIVWFYFGKLIWPAKLIFIYPHWDVRTSLAWSIGLIGVCAVTVVLWSLRRRARAPLAVWLLFVGTLFPALGFFNVYPFIFSYVADHWQYLACLAPLALAGEGLARLGFLIKNTSADARSGMMLTTLVSGPLVLALGVKTFFQAGTYRDAEHLYRVTINQNPACWMAHNNLGLVLLDRGAVNEAEEHFRAAIALRPTYSDAHNNLGNAFVRQSGQLEQAAKEYAMASQLEPRDGEIHFNLGNALAGLDRVAEAVHELELAVSLLPGRAEMHASLGLAFVQAGRLADAERELRIALELDPNSPVAHYNLARLLREPNQQEEAFAHYRAALRLTPKLAPVWNSYGAALLRAHQLDGASEAFREAVRLDPKNARFHNNLGIALRDAGQLDAAAQEFRRSLSLDPSFGDAHYNLGLTFEKAGRTQEADTEFQRSGRN